MCLITTPKKERYEVRRDYDAPRPVSNYQGGPHHYHDHARQSRTSRTYSRPPADRVSYRRSVSRTRAYEAEPRRSGRSVDYVRTSRTYVR